ncbi:MAG: gluconokinase [Acidimicrobiales bacterium]
MPADDGPSTIIVMGVSGSGKTTVGRALAESLGFEYLDADWLHTAINITKMAGGDALNDLDRLPWLDAIGQRLREVRDHGRSSVTACSALKRRYRDVLRDFVPDTYFVFLSGSQELLQSRLDVRKHQFMPTSLLASQLAILEPLEEDEQGLRVDITCDVNHIVGQIRTTLGA